MKAPLDVAVYGLSIKAGSFLLARLRIKMNPIMKLMFREVQASLNLRARYL